MQSGWQDPSAEAFPSTWMLLKPQVPPPNRVGHDAASSIYPKDWSLSTTPEPREDQTDTHSQTTSETQSTIKGGFPIALSDVEDTASTVLPPPTFERNWTLPPTPRSDQDAARYTVPISSSWSPGVPNPPEIQNAAYSGIFGTFPRHAPNIVHQQTQDTSRPSVAGNFKPSGYSDPHVNSQSSSGPSSAESFLVAENGIVRRLVQQKYFASPDSVASGTGTASSVSNVSGRPAGNVRFAQQFSAVSSDLASRHVSASYQPRRPAGFGDPTPDSQSESQSASSQSYHPQRPAGFGVPSPENATQNHSQSVSDRSYYHPRPAGFGPDNITPVTSDSIQGMQMQRTMPYKHVEGMANEDKVSTTWPQWENREPFAPIELPEQANTLPNVAPSWIYANADELYKPVEYN